MENNDDQYTMPDDGYETTSSNRLRRSLSMSDMETSRKPESQFSRLHSPALRIKTRSRPILLLSRKQKEELEYEEMKNFKIKANPIPKNVFDGIVRWPVVPKKPQTVPTPFNLTETQKKKPILNEYKTFKARPAPIHILEKPDIPVRQITKHVREHSKNQTISHDLCKPQPTSAGTTQRLSRKRTLPIPFSFLKHDEERKKRKEAKIQDQIEQELKKASSFKARPVPAAVKKIVLSTAASSSSENKENVVNRNNPPIVLCKEQIKHDIQSSTDNSSSNKSASEKRAGFKKDGKANAIEK